MLNIIMGKASPRHLSGLPKSFNCFKELEVHLEYDDLFCNYTETVKHLVDSRDRFDLPVLHSPMKNEHGEYLVIGMINEDKRKAFLRGAKKTIDLARDSRGDEKTLIVVHSGENITYRDIKTVKRNLIRLFFYEDLDILTNYISKTNSNVEICIENLSTMSIDDGRGYYRTFGYDEELITWVEDYNHPRVGLTLDTCHLLHTLRYPPVIPMGKHQFSDLESSLGKFIDSECLKLVHLANCINFGLVDLEHGAVFDKHNHNDMHLLTIFLEMLSRRPDVPITLEVNELDNSNPINKVDTYELIKSIV